jgi:hypothetical protein
LPHPPSVEKAFGEVCGGQTRRARLRPPSRSRTDVSVPGTRVTSEHGIDTVFYIHANGGSLKRLLEGSAAKSSVPVGTRMGVWMGGLVLRCAPEATHGTDGIVDV